jgi:hypothetical protein
MRGEEAFGEEEEVWEEILAEKCSRSWVLRWVLPLVG